MNRSRELKCLPQQWDETDGAAEEDLCEGLQEQLLEDDDDDDRVESM